MKRFTSEPLVEMFEWIQAQQQDQPAGYQTAIEVYVPDLKPGQMDGELVSGAHGTFRARSLRSFVDLAMTLGCAALTPVPSGDHLVRITFQKLDRTDSWHRSEPSGTEKYGTRSPYARVSKLEEPTFVAGFLEALSQVDLARCNRVVDLGVNTGDELALLQRAAGSRSSHLQFTGIDHCETALSKARDRFSGPNVEWIVHDINHIDRLGLPPCDLLVSIATLHSPGIDSKRVFMWLIQNLLTSNGKVILGFPNCRWYDGHVVYGAKTLNRTESDLSLLIKDIYFIKKYLQQHKFKVTIAGKNYLFLTGIKPR